MGSLVSQQPLQEVLLLTVTSVRSGPSCFTASEAGHVLGAVRPLAFSPTGGARGGCSTWCLLGVVVFFGSEWEVLLLLVFSFLMTPFMCNQAVCT